MIENIVLVKYLCSPPGTAKLAGMSAPRSARDRVRQELTREILDVARAHLARDGAGALSLRSIARELEMAPSALYRYFSSRDDLLSALILDAYESLADCAEAAAEAAADAAAGSGRHDLAGSWSVAPRSIRGWAVDHPHEWGLVFGSPVPGYRAPEATVIPYVRLAAAVVRPVVAAQRDGRLRPPRGPLPPDRLGASIRPVAEELLPGLPTATVARALQVWAALIGIISLEVFGHWRNTVLEPSALFDWIVADLGRDLGLDG
jgi:AcrR family transcriptional regulator